MSAPLPPRTSSAKPEAASAEPNASSSSSSATVAPDPSRSAAAAVAAAASRTPSAPPASEALEEAARRAYDEKCRLMEANQKSRDDKGGALGLANTRAAIEKAVAEAAKLPESQRSKKLNALALKWHPDKHEHLREMATEVTQIINETVQRLIDCGGSDMEGNSDDGNESGGGRSGGSSGSPPRRPGASCNVDID